MRRLSAAASVRGSAGCGWTASRLGGCRLPAWCIPSPTCASAFVPEAGAQCVSSARWDLRGGPPARAVPTAISPKGRESYGGRGPIVVAGVTSCQGGREGRPQGKGVQVTGRNNPEVCVMQNAEKVLGVLHDRGKNGLPCNELYRQMFNKELYLMAYGRIYANHGAMTPGASAETADGMSEDKIHEIIEAMRAERYRFSPVRRTFIPKKNGKLRPLGLPTWSDKL